MSHDGQESFVLVTLDDDSQIDELASLLQSLEDSAEEELLRSAVVLEYSFGFGKTRAIPLDWLDELAEIPWERWDDSAYHETRFLTAEKVEPALEKVRKLLRKPRTLASRIGRIVESEDDETVLEMLRAKPSRDFDASDAATTGSRVAQLLRALRFSLKRATRRRAALVLFRHELSG